MKNCLFCKKCISDPEVGYECSLNTPGNWVHSWKEQTSNEPCKDFELDRKYLEEQVNSKCAASSGTIEVIPKMKDYCVTFLPKLDNVEERLMKIKQAFMKLPEESAKKLKKLFEDSEEFIIEEFKIEDE